MNEDKQKEELKPKDYPSEPIPLESLNLNFMRHNKVLPIKTDDGFLELATADLNNQQTVQGWTFH